MTKDRQTPTAAPQGATRFARAGFERPVEHLHFDRRARVWRSHADLHPAAADQAFSIRTTADGVFE